MLLKKWELLKGNVALLPLVILLNALGFHLEKGKRNVFGLIHSSFFIIALLLSGILIYNKIDYADGVVVSTIFYINCSCIYFTLIIISFNNMFPKERRLWDAFKCFDNIDVTIQTTFHIKCNSEIKKQSNVKRRQCWSGILKVTSLFLLIGAFVMASTSILLLEYLNHHQHGFNAGRCIHAIMVFILSVKISFYCMLVHCIKARFNTLNKYLRQIESSQMEMKAAERTTKIIRAKKLFVSESVRQVSQLKELSLIYDEMLEIISLLNDSFSTLLSFAFSK